MKSLNFWRSLFFSALAAAAFGACSDDDKGGDVDASITVNDKEATTIGIASAGGETEAVSVVSSGTWTLAFESDQDWCIPNITSGKAGTSSLVFTVDPMPAGIEERSAVAVLSATGEIYGVPYTVTAKITVLQSPSGEIVTPVLIYKETFGTDANVANTDVDKYTGWTKTGEGAAGVTYAGTNVSVRKSSPNNSSSYEEASGAPILFFGNVPARFIVQNIALTPEQTHLHLTFGGQQTIDYDKKDYTWSNANLLVALSAMVRPGRLSSTRPTMATRTAPERTGCWLPPTLRSRLRPKSFSSVSCRLFLHPTCVSTTLRCRRVRAVRSSIWKPAIPFLS